jgi:hypothetical protein
MNKNYNQKIIVSKIIKEIIIMELKLDAYFFLTGIAFGNSRLEDV